MSIKFIIDYPALFIPEKKILVISDVQIGLEHELYQKGIVIHAQVERFLKTLDKLLHLTKAKFLVIIGDLKHQVPGKSLRELKEIPKFLEYIVKKVKVIIVKGNHDDYIETIVPKEVKVYSSRGFKLGKYGFFHGHAWPSKTLMKCDYLFMGHLQPGIEFRDELGFRNIEQVWLKGKLNQDGVKKKYKINKTGKLNLVILPAFNNLLGCAVLNTLVEEDYTGPFLKNKILDIENSSAYLLDGTYLDKIKNLRTR